MPSINCRPEGYSQRKSGARQSEVGGRQVLDVLHVTRKNPNARESVRVRKIKWHQTSSLAKKNTLQAMRRQSVEINNRYVGISVSTELDG